jgi:hypothetical protein
VHFSQALEKLTFFSSSPVGWDAALALPGRITR